MLSKNIGMNGLGSNAQVFSEQSTEAGRIQNGPGTDDAA
jgi:hypothetical protein